ncbi:hypothetical protein [Phycicoccus flavus]|uniref:Uncharacterized protein n=1 Tax=Phycicoccus flavus TaxID=2502783 RepID=A0A8T6QYZ8_9MICO|nr:hypothetical protein [Phycicoccus flavus]NHA66867.1 hypothetical protein [Phycicoccus flavus]
MSTYGTAVALDLAPSADVAGVLPTLGAWTAWRRPLVDGWTRLTLSCAEVEQLDEVRAMLVIAGTGCAAVAEDDDEYGACWTVLAARPDVVRTVHRRYLLCADPRDAREVRLAVADLGEDPRVRDVGGPEAAREAAEMFGVDPEPMVQAEAASDLAFERMGTVGGPFPWWWALDLTWPGDEAGERVPG